jgi:HSP20 family protein
MPSLLRAEEGSPFFALQREMNRMFDDFFRGSEGLPALSAGGWGLPRVDVAETDTEVKVTADLPGMEEKDVEIVLQDGVLTLRGEKKAEVENAVYSERWHGRFERAIPLGPDVDPEKVTASFRNGVLTVTAAKRPEAQRTAKRIKVNS